MARGMNFRFWLYVTLMVMVAAGTVAAGTGVASIRDLMGLPDGAPVTIGEKVVSRVVTDNVFYLEEPTRSAGIRVINQSGTVVAAGDVVTVAGTMTTVNLAERAVNCNLISVLSHGAAPGPLGVDVRDLLGHGVSMTGLLVRTWGTVISTGNDTAPYFWLKGASNSRAKVYPTGDAPDLQSYVTVTGCAGAKRVGTTATPAIYTSTEDDTRTLQAGISSAVLAYNLYPYTGPGWAWGDAVTGAVTVAIGDNGGRFNCLEMSVWKSAVSGVTGSAVWEIGSGTFTSVNWQPPLASAVRTISVDGFFDDWSGLTPIVPPWECQVNANPIVAGFSAQDGASYYLCLKFRDPILVTNPWDLYFYINTTGMSGNGYVPLGGIGGNYLIQNVGVNISVPINVAGLSAEPGVLTVGQQTVLNGVVENTTGSDSGQVDVTLSLPAGLTLAVGEQPSITYSNLRSKEVKQLTWHVSAAQPGRYSIELKAAWSGSSILNVRKRMTILVEETRNPQFEYQSQDGGWNLLPAKTTLQTGNTAPLQAIPTKSSSDIVSNYVGITAQVERDHDEEVPFAASYLVDSNVDSHWACRVWRIPTPIKPEYVQIDLGTERPVGEVRILPAWLNHAFPKCFEIETSTDGVNWSTTASLVNYSLVQRPPGPLTVGDRSYQAFPFSVRQARYVRIRFLRLVPSGRPFFCMPMDPYQVWLAEVQLYDAPGGSRIAIAPDSVSVSSTYTAWYNTPESIGATTPLLYNSGSKWTRIGQWGDKSEWAVIEKTKGVYTIDPYFESKITQMAANGLNIVWTLDYGNDLYQTNPSVGSDIGPVWKLGHPFYKSAPTTDEAIQGFCNYAAFVVNRFKDRVKYWEIWNEENGWFQDGVTDPGSTAMCQKYGKLLKAVARRIKEVDPTVQVYFGGLAGFSLDYFRIALTQGAAPYIDGIAYHPYRGYPLEKAATYLTDVNGKFQWIASGQPDYEAEVAELRSMLDTIKPGLKLMVTEQNVFALGDPPMRSMGDTSEFYQAKCYARSVVQHSWLQIPFIWWSIYNNNGIQEWAVVRSSDATPRLAYYASGTLGTLLDGAEPFSMPISTTGQAPDLYTKVFRKPDGEVLVALWSASNSTDDNYTPQAVEIRLPAFLASSATICDPLYGQSQPALFSTDPAGVTTVSGVLVPDYPVIVRLTGTANCVTVPAGPTLTYAQTPLALQDGRNYVIYASGVYGYAGILSYIADPEWFTMDRWAVKSEFFADSVPPNVLDLHIIDESVGGSGMAVDWEGRLPDGTYAVHTYSPTHEYRYRYTGRGAKLKFFVSDWAPYGEATYYDNTGSLTVAVAVE